MPKDSMYIVKATPFVKHFKKEVLTYFSPQLFAPGMIISIPIRKKKVHALVLECDTVTNLKTEVKSADFNLKKIEKQTGHFLYLPAHITAAAFTAKETLTNQGSLLESITPAAVLEALSDTENIPPMIAKPSDTYYESLILQTSFDERILQYKKIIRESFARKQSVLICVPTVQSVKKLASMISKGIAPYVFTFSSSMSKKKIIESWMNALKNVHPVIIITTPGSIGIARNDIGTYIIEGEGSHYFRRSHPPLYDPRLYLEHIARHSPARIIFGDSILSHERFWEYKNGSARALAHPRGRVISSARVSLINMNNLAQKSKKNLTIFSDEMKSEITKTLEKGNKAILFIARKGLYPITLCGDCGNVVRSEYSDMPVVVKEENSERVFVCPTTGKKRSALEACKVCKSWNLVTLGIGIDLAHEKLTKAFNIPIFKISQDATTTPKQVEDTLKAFEDEKRALLLTTSMGLEYITNTVPFVGVITIDSLFAIPDTGITHRIARMLFKLRSLAKETFLVQYRNADVDLLELITGGNIQALFERESKERKELGYPPFSKFIKIQLSGNKETLKTQTSRIREVLQAYSPEIYPAFVPRKNGIYTYNILIKVDTLSEDLNTKLKSLPPSFRIEVNPGSIL